MRCLKIRWRNPADFFYELKSNIDIDYTALIIGPEHQVSFKLPEGAKSIITNENVFDEIDKYLGLETTVEQKQIALYLCKGVKALIDSGVSEEKIRDLCNKNYSAHNELYPLQIAELQNTVRALEIRDNLLIIRGITSFSGSSLEIIKDEIELRKKAEQIDFSTILVAALKGNDETVKIVFFGTPEGAEFINNEPDSDCDEIKGGTFEGEVKRIYLLGLLWKISKFCKETTGQK